MGASSAIKFKPKQISRLNRNHPSNKGLLYSFNFAQGGGDKLYDAASGLMATMSGFTLSTDWTPTEKGMALSFNGSSKYVSATLPKAATFPLSLHVRFKSASSIVTQAVLAMDSLANDGIRLELGSGSQISIVLGGVAAYTFSGLTYNTTAIIDLLVTIDKNSGSAIGYLRSTEDPRTYTDTKAIGNMGGTASSLVIGQRGDSQTYYTGLVYDVNVWDRVLSGEEASQFFMETYGTAFNPRFINKSPRLLTAKVTAVTLSATGSNSSTDEVVNPGGVAQPLGGSKVSTDEALRVAAITVGAVQLGGSFSASDEAEAAGSISNLPYHVLWSQIADHLANYAPGTVPSPGGTAYLKVVLDWGGAALDRVNGKLYVLGGGHAGYSGNEVYVVDLATRTLSRLTTPTANAIIAASDSVTSSGDYATNSGGGTADPAAPRSRHPYNYANFTNGKLYLVFAMYVYDTGGTAPSANKLSMMTTAGVWSHGTASPYTALSYDGATAIDENGHIWVYNGVFITEYDPVGDSWTSHGNTSQTHEFNGAYVRGDIDPTSHRMYCFGQGLCGYFDTHQAGNIAWVPVTSTGPQTIVNAKAPGIAFHPASGYFIGWSGGQTAYAFDPATATWYQIAMDSTNTVVPTAAASNGTFGRFDYCAPLDLFVAVNAMDENVFLMNLKGLPKNLTGGTSTADEAARAGTLALGAVNLAGAQAKTDEAVAVSTLATAAGITGSFSTTGEVLNISTVAPGAIGLAGSIIRPDELLFGAGVTPGAVTLTGLFLATDEKAYQAGLTLMAMLQGAGILTDEQARVGALSLGAVGLSGQFATADERASAGALALGGALLSGQAIASDELARTATLALGPANVQGAAVLTDEQARAGIMAPGAVNVAGQFAAADEKASAGVLGLGGALLSGLGITSDEIARAGALALGAATLTGQVVRTDEAARAGQLTTLIGMVGAAIGTDEKTIQGVVNILSGLQGVNIATDERIATSVFTVGGVVLVGSYSPADDSVRISVLVAGSIVTQTIRKLGPYTTSIRKVGAYNV